MNLLSDIKICDNFVKRVTESPENFYVRKERPKKKYGREQKDKNGDVKKRITYSPISFLKIKQREINQCLQNIQLPDCMFGGVKGRNHILNALEHIDANYFYTVDLKDYFSNISANTVKKALTSCGVAYQDANLIKRLCTLNDALPQGAPTSSLLANLAFSSTAKLLEEFCGQRNIKVTVFVDDITFSSKNDFKYANKDILAIIKNGGFLPSYRKIHYRHRSCEVAGLIIKNKQLQLGKEMLRNADNPYIKNYKKYVEKQYCAFRLSQSSRH